MTMQACDTVVRRRDLDDLRRERPELLAHRVHAETLMIVCMADTVCPPWTQFAAHNKIQSKKDVLVSPTSGTRGYPAHQIRASNYWRNFEH